MYRLYKSFDKCWTNESKHIFMKEGPNVQSPNNDCFISLNFKTRFPADCLTVWCRMLVYIDSSLHESFKVQTYKNNFPVYDKPIAQRLTNSYRTVKWYHAVLKGFKLSVTKYFLTGGFLRRIHIARADWLRSFLFVITNTSTEYEVWNKWRTWHVNLKACKTKLCASSSGIYSFLLFI